MASIGKFTGEVNDVRDRICKELAPYVRSVSAVAISQDDILFHIESYRRIDERRFRLTLEIECGLDPALFKEPLSEWSVLFVSGCCADIRFFDAGWSFDIAFVDLVLLALEETQIEYRSLDLHDILFTTEKDVMIGHFRTWINGTLTSYGDRFSPECIEELRPFWLCCPRHRRMRLLRYFFHRRLGRYETDEKTAQEPVPDHFHPGEYDHPDDASMLALAQHYLEEDYTTPYALLSDFLFHNEQAKGWYEALPSCQFHLHGYGYCCLFHALHSAIGCLFYQWFDYWMWRYAVPFRHTDDGHPYGVGLSTVSFARFCYDAHIPMESFVWRGGYYENVPIYVEILRSGHIFQKFAAYYTHTTTIEYGEQEHAFLDSYATRYGVSRAVYDSFLFHFLLIARHYAKDAYFLRIESEEEYSTFLSDLLTLPESPMRQQAIQRLEQEGERERNNSYERKPGHSYERGRFILSFHVLRLLMGEL